MRYLAWVGQNATTGTPHKVTGNMSMYGKLVSFDKKTDRDVFVDGFYSNNPSEFARKTNAKEAKTLYLAGLTQNQFDEYLQHVEFAWDD